MYMCVWCECIAHGGDGVCMMELMLVVVVCVCGGGDGGDV